MSERPDEKLLSLIVSASRNIQANAKRLEQIINGVDNEYSPSEEDKRENRYDETAEYNFFDFHKKSLPFLSTHLTKSGTTLIESAIAKNSFEIFKKLYNFEHLLSQQNVMTKHIYNMNRTKANRRFQKLSQKIHPCMYEKDDHEKFRKNLIKYRDYHMEDFRKYRIGPYGERTHLDCCIIQAVKSQNTSILNFILEDLKADEFKKWKIYVSNEKCPIDMEENYLRKVISEKIDYFHRFHSESMDLEIENSKIKRPNLKRQVSALSQLSYDSLDQTPVPYQTAINKVLFRTGYFLGGRDVPDRRDTRNCYHATGSLDKNADVSIEATVLSNGSKRFINRVLQLATKTINMQAHDAQSSFQKQKEIIRLLYNANFRMNVALEEIRSINFKQFHFLKKFNMNRVARSGDHFREKMKILKVLCNRYYLMIAIDKLKSEQDVLCKVDTALDALIRLYLENRGETLKSTKIYDPGNINYNDTPIIYFYACMDAIENAKLECKMFNDDYNEMKTQLEETLIEIFFEAKTKEEQSLLFKRHCSGPFHDPNQSEFHLPLVKDLLELDAERVVSSEIINGYIYKLFNGIFDDIPVIGGKKIFDPSTLKQTSLKEVHNIKSITVLLAFLFHPLLVFLHKINPNHWVSKLASAPNFKRNGHFLQSVFLLFVHFWTGNNIFRSEMTFSNRK